MRRTRSRWRRFTISSQSRHSTRTVLTNRSAMAFACGARLGVLTIRMPALRNTSSNEPVYLLSRSRISKRVPWSMRSRPRLRAGGVSRAADEPDASAFVRDQEQHVVAAQKHALDGEDVAGDDAGRLGAEEL